MDLPPDSIDDLARPRWRRLWQRLWPPLRALVVVYHVAMIVALSLPNTGALLHRPLWDNANSQADFAGWARALTSMGVEISGPELAARLWSAAERTAGVQRIINAPFTAFAGMIGYRQGWAMFASPQRHPFEVHVDLEVDGAWQPLYRPHDDDAGWRRATFEHNRFRKFTGTFARGFNRGRYDELARWIARMAAADHPEARRIRVQLYAYRTLPPERVRAGERPVGAYREPRIFSAQQVASWRQP